MIYFLYVCPYLYFLIDLFFFVVEDMSTLTPEQRLKFLEKAMAKKAHPDNKVDVLSQLKVGEGEKEKRKASDARISIPVKASSPSDTAADKAVDVGGETQVKSPAKKKSRTLSKKQKGHRDFGVGEGSAGD
jgi:hypothetical protein